MIVDYWILHSNNRDELIKAVNGEIAKGWQPFGGVSVSSFDFGAIGQFVQAMVRYE